MCVLRSAFFLFAEDGVGRGGREGNGHADELGAADGPPEEERGEGDGDDLVGVARDRHGSRGRALVGRCVGEAHAPTTGSLQAAGGLALLDSGVLATR